jgi:hypothetical protein
MDKDEPKHASKKLLFQCMLKLDGGGGVLAVQDDKTRSILIPVRIL